MELHKNEKNNVAFIHETFSQTWNTDSTYGDLISMWDNRRHT